MRPAALLRLEVMAPALIVLAGVADLGLRLSSLDRLAFRAWEALRVGGESGPFRPNHHYQNPRAYGDLANVGNLPALREYHREEVVTDSLGFRNPPGLAGSGQIRVILTGSSFTAGTEVMEDQTLASRLSQRLGVDVYNAALAEPDLATFRQLARRLRLSRGALVFEYLEGREAPSPAIGGAPGPVRCPLGIGDPTSVLCRTFNRWYERLRVSPVRVHSQRVLRRLQDDRLFPNPDRDRVWRATLRNGTEMLFQGSDPAWRPDRVSEDLAVRYFTWLERRLRREGLDLLVVLVPRKYTVYGPLLAPPPAEVDVGARSLQRIAERLARAAIPVVDLTASLRSVAHAGLDAGRYVYFRDDTHWNAAGITVAADVLAPRVAALRSR